MRAANALMAGTLAPALIFLATLGSARAQDATSPVDSLVLVIKVISDTHAQPVTGVVVRTSGDGPAHVLVPAAFVSAGDEIVVLDGGADLLRNGRAARTVARSAEAGVAVLEVKGLVRRGVELSADPWPPEGTASAQFAAWPAAAQLAEGAPLVRHEVQLLATDDESGVRVGGSLPAVSGPMFDGCGRLTAFWLAGEQTRLVAAQAVGGVFAEAGIGAVAAPCFAPMTQAAGAETVTDIAAEPEMAAADKGPQSQARNDVPPAGSAAEEPKSPTHWAWIAGPLALVLLVLWLRPRKRPPQPGVRLEPEDESGSGPSHWIPWRPGTSAGVLEHGGHVLAFEGRGGEVFVTDQSGESAPLALAVAGTPCLPGETFLIGQGNTLQVGGGRYRVELVAAGVKP